MGIETESKASAHFLILAISSEFRFLDGTFWNAKAPRTHFLMALMLSQRFLIFFHAVYSYSSRTGLWKIFFCRERYCTSFLWTIPTRSTVSSQANDFISSLVSRRTAWHRLVCSHKRLIQSHASTQSYCSSYLPLWLLWGRENISYSFLDILVAYPESTMYTTFLCFSLHFYCQPSI